ncbi:hypothetical protein FUA26_11650 [Seonamhaeicola algicola]|uniref:Uncharacterized protein n=1 Tax=Seonamhaeicola algicola TaxID=1719036 RepID=A0A5C7AP45_9FLAO|nr:hypothetical protein [Seonamhaeicola algicola]TXE10121.1 hypothetical protein FUA26_11650 [Seonamhaeicola algicola]
MRFLIFILLGMSAFSQTKFEGIAIKASVPVGWQVQEENYGQVMLSNSNEQAAIMLIEHGWANEHVILQNMQETIQEDGMQAALATDIMQLDNGNYIALYQGSYSNGQEIILVAVVSKSKLWQIGGVMTLVLVPKQAFKDSYQDLAVEISKSITYLPFMNSAAKQKANMFKGRKLVKYSSYYTSNYGGSISVGSNIKVTINFCSNGQFAFNGYSDFHAGGGAFDGEVSSNNSEGIGLWNLMVIKNYMVIRLVSNAGEVNYMPIERYTEDGAFYINGDKWVIGASDVCN